ncbi:MAG: response regulator transcription factor [Bacteroidetes bacterium]|nr:response regulator transcription factor [Bacteroidota bacterium]
MMETRGDGGPQEHVVLVVDDDEALVKALLLALQDEGYRSVGATSGREALRQVYEHHPDLIILDLMMPDMDGYETCRRVRDVSNVPILMLTAKTSEEDMIKGLDSGADDYVVKPFGVKALLARVQALLRRAEFPSTDRVTTKLVNGDLEMDLVLRRVTIGGKHVKLTPTEFRLLSCLMQRPGETVSHKDLLTRVWGPEYQEESQYLKLYIGYLRRKVEPDPKRPARIISERGFGYYIRRAERLAS